MSTGQRPSSRQERRSNNIENLKKGVLSQTRKGKEETDESFTKRLRTSFSNALGAMFKREKALFSSNPKPHQGPKECARRREQAARGAIWNYDRETHYMTRG